ncbi:ATP-binding protein [Pseudoduganella sp. R-43]|uniref:ATP-binding protein n=1 Tax=Pseudoduganella sp. R-43 TaxID=3404063 RepID=UPI003CF09821
MKASLASEDGAAGAASTVAGNILHASGRQNMRQLIALRWLAVLGQGAAIMVCSVSCGVPLPLPAMLSVLGCLAVFNIASVLRCRGEAAVSNGELLWALLADVACLTVQLHLSGGISNPFAFLYLLQVMLSVLLLDQRSSWLVVGASTACLAALAVFSRPLELPADLGSGIFSLYIQGVLLCFVLIAGLLVMFTGRIICNLRRTAGKLADLRQQAVEEEHVVRLGLLASGAAHELGTPLATMAVILGDWRRMPEFSSNRALRAELGEMEAQLRRCKTTVSSILLCAGQTRGELSRPTTINAFLSGLAAEWRIARTVADFEFDNRIGRDVRIVSDSIIKQTICNLLDNALEASPQWLRMEASIDGEMLAVRVTDAGPGFTVAMLAQFGKPYHSSKGREGGGLGLFLAMNVARRLGGTLAAANLGRGGAKVCLRLPLAAITLEELHDN